MDAALRPSLLCSFFEVEEFVRRRRSQAQTVTLKARLLLFISDVDAAEAGGTCRRRRVALSRGTCALVRLCTTGALLAVTALKVRIYSH